MTVPTQAAPSAKPRRRTVLLGARALVWVVYAYVIVTEVVLGLGFLLLLFGANPDASFVAWAYRSLERAMEPFRGMFTPIDLGLGTNDEVGAVLDTSIIFAMLVYAIVALFLSWLLDHITDYLSRLDYAARLDAAQARPPQDLSHSPGSPGTLGPRPTTPPPPPTSPPPAAS